VWETVPPAIQDFAGTEGKVVARRLIEVLQPVVLTARTRELWNGNAGSDLSSFSRLKKKSFVNVKSLRICLFNHLSPAYTDTKQKRGAYKNHDMQYLIQNEMKNKCINEY